MLGGNTVEVRTWCRTAPGSMLVLQTHLTGQISCGNSSLGTRATPSSSLVPATMSATAFTSSGALPIAMPIPRLSHVHVVEIITDGHHLMEGTTKDACQLPNTAEFGGALRAI